jgi:lysophospholipase L1-like esterase
MRQAWGVGVAILAACALFTPTAGSSIGVGDRLPASGGASSSRGHPVPVALLSAADIEPGAITFDEFGLGTTITDDYANLGVVFTSEVFLTTDGSSSTSPVLTGTPKFFGDISARFTTPGTTSPATVDGFSLDVGYIDNRDSVEIQYFDAGGGLVGSTRAQSYGINRIDIGYRGIASFTVKAVEYEAAGFAIDNLVIRRGAIGIQPTRMAMFGDSYSSGEGLLPKKNLQYDCGTDLHEGRYFEGTTAQGLFWESDDCQTATGSRERPGNLFRRPLKKYKNLCHRNRPAYPNQIRERLGVAAPNAIFVACSGAETKHVVGPAIQYPDSPPGVHGGQPQLENVKKFAEGGSPDLVTIGIGGNDGGFDKIAIECIIGTCTELDFASRTISTINGTMYRNVTATFEALRSTFPGATIVAFGYPSVIDDPGQWCAGLLGIDADERSWLKNAVLPAINDAIKDAADYAGIVYVDITATTVGHGVCSSDAWINGARLGDDSWYRKGNESFHPNQKAHDAIASYFIDHYTDGNKHLLVANPDPEAPIRSDTGPEIQLGDVDIGAARQCGADCLQPAACIQACKLHLQGDGFAPGVTMGVTLQSNPVSLGQVVADPEGRLDVWFGLPAGLEPGLHSLTLDGLADDGTRQHASRPFTVFARLAPKIGTRFRLGKQGTEIQRLAIKRVPAGTRVDIACARGGRGVTKVFAVGHVKRRGGCPFSHRAFRIGRAKTDDRPAGSDRDGGRLLGSGRRKHSGSASQGRFGSYFGSSLKPGTVVRVVIAHRGWAGRTLDLRIRAGKRPKLVGRCTEPGLRTPMRC